MRDKEDYEGAVVIVADGGVQPETLVVEARYHTSRAGAIFGSVVSVHNLGKS